MTTEALVSHHHADACKNCGVTTSGNFCHQCGQATHLHVPSAREFLHEFIAHYVALEGKLWRSLMLLFSKPGLLTREYIEGRRVRYVEPLRLYLSFSIIFFALFKFSGVTLYNNDSPVGTAPAAIGAPARSAPAPDVVLTSGARVELNDDEREIARQLGTVNSRLGTRMENFFRMARISQTEVVKRAFYSYTPYAIFLLMPLFALFLKLLYLGSGRRYGEHFLFALHSNAFAFFTMSLVIVADGWDFVQAALVAWLVFYLPTAMRRVYGGTRRLTALRWLVLLALHLLSLSIAVFAVVMAGVVQSS